MYCLGGTVFESEECIIVWQVKNETLPVRIRPCIMLVVRLINHSHASRNPRNFF